MTVQMAVSKMKECDEHIKVLDNMKSNICTAYHDVKVPEEKDRLIRQADALNYAMNRIADYRDTINQMEVLDEQ